MPSYEDVLRKYSLNDISYDEAMNQICFIAGSRDGTFCKGVKLSLEHVKQRYPDFQYAAKMIKCLEEVLDHHERYMRNMGLLP